MSCHCVGTVCAASVLVPMCTGTCWYLCAAIVFVKFGKRVPGINGGCGLVDRLCGASSELVYLRDSPRMYCLVLPTFLIGARCTACWNQLQLPGPDDLAAPVSHTWAG